MFRRFVVPMVTTLTLRSPDPHPSSSASSWLSAESPSLPPSEFSVLRLVPRESTSSMSTTAKQSLPFFRRAAHLARRSAYSDRILDAPTPTYFSTNADPLTWQL
jgi:hypothetical protein